MSLSKRVKSKERKGLLADAVAAIKGLSIEELINLRFELGRQLNQQSVVCRDIQTRLDAVRFEIDARGQGYVGYRITDHAVLRYLERHKGLDVNAVRQEIVELVKDTKGIDLGRRRHSALGLTMGVDESVNGLAITTVFHDRELPVMKVPEPR